MATGAKKARLACPRCSFIGKSEQSLKVHIGRAHKRQKRRANAKMKVGRRRSGCSVCGKGLKTPAALKAHMTRMHPGMSGRSLREAEVSPLQRHLVGWSLANLADLHDACRAELRRRLAE